MTYLPGRSAGSTFTFTQETPLAAWTVVHNLGRHPTVNIVTPDNDEVEADVHYIDTNTVIISFAIDFAGIAYLN